MSADRPARHAPVRRLLTRHLVASGRPLVAAAACTAGMAAADLLRPWPLKLVLDHVLLQQPVPGGLAPLSALLAWGPGPALVVCAAGIVAVALVTGAFAYYQVHFTTAVGNRLVRDLRRELFAHLQRLSLSFHTRTASGELLTTVASDTAALRDTFTEGVLTLGLHALTIAGIFALMWWMNWRLALVVTATLPLLGWNLVQLYTRTRARTAAQRKTQAAMASRLHEVFASLPMVQAFGRERHEHQRFETQNEADLAESVQAARLDALSARSVELIGAVATAVVVGAGALEVLAGRLSVGALLVFTSYLHGLYRPMRTLAKLSARFAKARVSAGRIADILGTAPELDDRPDAIGVERLAGDVVFDRVSFAYEPGRPVLQDVSFHVRPGQRVAVVGPSGAGKSTLVSLLLRLYAPTGGRILVDGVDIAAYRRESLRQAMAVVLQHTVLFGASIRENIAYGKLDATDADVREAARRAGADDFIQALPRGYDTVVGERGATLSGGQRQRLSIARAMIRPASILLLDEPMTGLDHRTETAVHDALARAAAGRTALLVTHDLATAASADLVLVLDGGRLVDAGTHEALIGRCALYRHLHRGAGARDGEAVPA